MSNATCQCGAARYQTGGVHCGWYYGGHLHIGVEKFCPDCGTRLNADGTTTVMAPVVTSEAVAATRFMQVWESMDRTDAEFYALVELGLLVEDKDNRRGDAVRFFDNAPDAGVLIAALQQSGRGDARARWLAEQLEQHNTCTCCGVELAPQLPSNAGAWEAAADAAMDAEPPVPSQAGTLLSEAAGVMQDFVDKCDQFDSQSAHTYAACRTWLARWAGAALADASLDATGEPPVPSADAVQLVMAQIAKLRREAADCGGYFADKVVGEAKAITADKLQWALDLLLPELQSKRTRADHAEQLAAQCRADEDTRLLDVLAEGGLRVTFIRVPTGGGRRVLVMSMSWPDHAALAHDAIGTPREVARALRAANANKEAHGG